MDKVLEAMAVIEKAAQEAKPNLRVVARHEVGRAERQGDVYLHHVPAGHVKGDKTELRQLAVGTTMGSRHVAEGDVEVYLGTGCPSGVDGRTPLGPRLVVGPEGCTVTHPEHAHVQLPPGDYQVTHQMDARTWQRVQD